MGQIEREIKILNVDVDYVKSTLKKNGIKPKGKFIQDIYAFDLPSVNELYMKYLDKFLKCNDKRGLEKLILEIRPCFDKEDIALIKRNLGFDDILAFINSSNNDFSKLKSSELYELMEKVNKNFSKWVRLRKTGNEITITIKKIVNSKGEYELDAVDELEFEVPSIEDGLQLLEDLGYFFARHQTKMRIAYDYKNTEIVIDKWPKLEPYVEIEGSSKEDIEEAILMLGYNLKDAIVINTDDVYSKNGIDIYSSEYSDLSFGEKELETVNLYLK